MSCFWRTSQSRPQSAASIPITRPRMNLSCVEERFTSGSRTEQAKQSLRTPILTRGLRQQAPEETGEQPPSSSNWQGSKDAITTQYQSPVNLSAAISESIPHEQQSDRLRDSRSDRDQVPQPYAGRAWRLDKSVSDLL